MAEPLALTMFTNLGSGATNLSSGEVNISAIMAENTSGANAWLGFFDAAAANVTVGTTVPMFEVVLPASTGFQFITFSHPLRFVTRMSAFSATASGGGTGSGANVNAQAWTG